MVVYAPINSRSGYGDHSREIVRALMRLHKWDVRILPCGWGNTPLNVDTPDLNPFVIRQLTFQPDIWVMITVPNEFQPQGKYKSIGITAGMETTGISKEWVDGCNRMDLVITTSEHSKNVILNTEWTSNTGDKIKVHKPVEVLFEGLDETIWTGPQPPVSNALKKILKDLPQKQNFLFVGHWLKGDHRHDRKDVGGLIEAYRDTFKDYPEYKRPGLVLKTSGAGFSVTDREMILNRIQSIYGAPSIHLLHGDLTEAEMRYLYSHNKMTAMVSFTHGEGYGRPLQEAAACGLPVIAPNWSGQVDFLKGRHIPLVGQLQPVHPSAVWDNMIIKESQWFYADLNYASKVMKKVADKPDHFKQKAKLLQKDILDNFTFTKMTEKLDSILTEHAGVKFAPLQFG